MIRFELMKSVKKRIVGLVILALVLAAAGGFYATAHAPGHKTAPSGQPANRQPAFNKQQYSTGEAGSLWAVVNKGRILPKDYIPADLVVPNVPLRLGAGAEEMHLRRTAADALQMMFAGAQSQGLRLMLASGYRSYTFQVNLYSSYVAASGQAAADTFSARPGHSEHQTGLAADVEPASRRCEVDTCFAKTPEGKWLAANAYKYGFIIRYPKGQEKLTGYEYEPWHIRYVGKVLAGQIHRTGQTLEQFFGLPAYADYPARSFQLKD